MKRAFTPGPWEVASGGGIMTTIRTADRRIAIALYENGSEDAGTPEANAQLIAAAPDLLAALEALGEHFKAERDIDFWPCLCAMNDPALDCVYCRASIAIAKARGGSS
jgi:hypothetical protein